MVDTPDHCTSDKDCGNADVLRCDHEKRDCVCKEDFHVRSPEPGGTCLPAKQMGEACKYTVQCELLDKHAICSEEECVCDSGFYALHETNGSLCKRGDTTEAPSHPLDQNMIIVICVLAVMFIGICVALHLFSRARFRNRRTIFNSPHPRLMHIKLGKKKKKKLSERHHLPPPHYPVPRHHSFSGQGHHSPLPNSRVPKTRSHECLRSAISRDSSPKFEVRSKTAPLAEKESLPSSEDLVKKTPEPMQNGPTSLLNEESQPVAPGSPTVIITDADGSHTVVATKSPTGSSSAVNV